MKPLMFVGVLLILIGAVVLIRGLSVTTKDQVADIGPIEVNREETRTIPPWAGGLAAAAGVAMVLVGAGKKNNG